jgi:hypothetical protein
LFDCLIVFPSCCIGLCFIGFNALAFPRTEAAGTAAPPVDIYADADTIPKIKKSFPYLFPELRGSHGPTAIGKQL